MSPEFIQLFSRYAGTGFAKQLAFADFLQERSWNLDLTTGRVSFGEDLSYPIQLLGTESYGDESWLWAWANQASQLPENLLATAHKLRQLGEQKAVTELTEPRFSLEVVHGHLFAMLASGLSSKSCYYRGPYQGGALFFLVRDVPAELCAMVPVERAITVIAQCIAEFDLNHRLFAESFLTQQKFELSAIEGGLSARRQQSEIKLMFDDLGRIADIAGTLAPATPT